MSVAAEIEPAVTPDVARCIAEEEIPIIDVGAYLAGDIEAREQLAVDLRAIQESLGFYVIVNHGVPQDLIDRSFEQVAELFALPLDTKMKYRVEYHHIGYIPDKASVLRWSKIADNQKKDINEAWAFMRERAPDDPKVVARKVLLEYQETMAVLAQRMLPVYARSLELPADYFDDKFSLPEYYNRCAYYPPAETEEGQFALAPHADHSSITYLPLSAGPRSDGAVGQVDRDRAAARRYRRQHRRVLEPLDQRALHRHAAPRGAAKEGPLRVDILLQLQRRDRGRAAADLHRARRGTQIRAHVVPRFLHHLHGR
jgi:hypothetical protein